MTLVVTDAQVRGWCASCFDRRVAAAESPWTHSIQPMSPGPKMPQTRPPMRRMLFIHEQLKHGRYPNCVQLGVEFELKGVRTILRDIAFMRDQLLLPVDYDASRRGYSSAMICGGTLSGPL